MNDIESNSYRGINLIALGPTKCWNKPDMSDNSSLGGGIAYCPLSIILRILCELTCFLLQRKSLYV